MRRLYELLEIEERMLEVEERMLDGRKQGRVLLGVLRVAVTEPIVECMELVPYSWHLWVSPLSS